MPANPHPYEFHQLLRSNGLLESWTATNHTTGQKCFLKRLVIGGTGQDSPLKAMMEESLRLQRRLHATSLLRFRYCSRDSDSLLVEYPYLSPDEWEPLSPQLLAGRWEQIFPKIAVTLDVLHLQGLVHGDLKLENFMFSKRLNTIYLVDLDFLTSDGSSPHARLFGTPGHIAPEILENFTVVTQSDLFSLGVSLRQVSPLLSGPMRERFLGFITELTRQDHLARPLLISEAACRYGLLSQERTQELYWQALAMTFAHHRASIKRAVGGGLSQLEHFLIQDLHLIGIPKELLETAVHTLQTNRSKFFEAIRQLPQNGSLQFNGGYWQLQLTDSQSCYFLELLHGDAVSIYPGGTTAIRGSLAEARHLLEQGKPLASLFMLQGLIRDSEFVRAEDSQDKWRLISATASTYTSRNRHGEAYRTLREAALLAPQDETPQLSHDAAVAAIRAGMIKEAKEILDSYEVTGRNEVSKALSLRFDRLRAWVLQLTGKLQESKAMLDEIREAAEESKDTELLVAVNYMYGIAQWRSGSLSEASDALGHAWSTAAFAGLRAQSLPVLVGLAMLAFDRSNYRRATTYARLAIRYCNKQDQQAITPSALVTIIPAYIKLGNTKKADYWLQRLFSQAVSDPSLQTISRYSILAGYACLQSGQLGLAEEHLVRLIHMQHSDVHSTTMIKAYHNLAELTLWRGDTARAVEFAECGLNLAHRHSESTAAAEIELIQFLARLSDSETSPDITELSRLAERLANLDCRYYACTASFHLLLRDCPLPASVSSMIEELTKMRDCYQVPLFAAVATLLSERENPSEEIAMISYWKRAYNYLATGKQHYLASVSASKLAEMYRATGLRMHAQAYFRQARKHAELLKNIKLVKDIDRVLDELSKETNPRGPGVDTFLAVSRLLRNPADYNGTLNKLVEFAVVHTGAERGVLLLRSSQQTKLQVVASFECDEKSLRDIQKISLGIAQAAVDQLEPFLIENAQVDERTNNFKSVVYHNILSVACIPLVIDQELFGVLYLDHHTIGSLFAPEDLQYIMAIANFLTVAITATQKIRSLTITNVNMREELNQDFGRGPFITRNPIMRNLIEQVKVIAAGSSTVLLIGESGTGKEIIAQQLHALSPRHDRPLVKVNCAALAPTIVEAELFGIAKGTATGVAEREGKFAAADGGTLFLDEIGDMSLEVQAKVLRAIEYQQFERVGSHRTIDVDIRFVCATHQDLRKLVQESRFRADLYYRINAICLEILPLRERPEDIILLAEHFFAKFATESTKPRLDSKALKALVEYSWPGNARQLRNVIEHCCLFYPGGIVTREMLPQDITATVQPQSEKGFLDYLERQRLSEALEKSEWNQSRAAALLGIPLTTFHRRLKKLGISSKPRENQ